MRCFIAFFLLTVAISAEQYLGQHFGMELTDPEPLPGWWLSAALVLCLVQDFAEAWRD